MSPKRIFGITAIFSMIVGAIFFTPVIFDIVKNKVEPVLVRQEISGEIRINGNLVAGANLRESKAKFSEPPSCTDIPVIATSDSFGRIYVASDYLPRHKVTEEFGFRLLCVEHAGMEIDLWFQLYDPSQPEPLWLECDFPGAQTGHPEDGPCQIHPNYSFKPTPLRGAA